MRNDPQNLSDTVRRMGPPQLDEASAALVVAKVAELLERFGTQPALAKRLGVSQSAVSQWIRGAARPSYTNALRVAAVAGVPVESLLALPTSTGEPAQMGSVLEERPNLRAAVAMFRSERPGEEEAVRTVCGAAWHLPDLDRGLWMSMLEQVERAGPPAAAPVKQKKHLS